MVNIINGRNNKKSYHHLLFIRWELHHCRCRRHHPPSKPSPQVDWRILWRILSNKISITGTSQKIPNASVDRNIPAVPLTIVALTISLRSWEETSLSPTSSHGRHYWIYHLQKMDEQIDVEAHSSVTGFLISMSLVLLTWSYKLQLSYDLSQCLPAYHHPPPTTTHPH